MTKTADANLGTRGEDIACEFLEGKGWQLLDRNYRFERKEVDLVFLDPGSRRSLSEIVFVEVKTRSSVAYGRPEEAITPTKQRAIMDTAEAYLYEKKLSRVRCRFDVIAIDASEPVPEITHIPNAFQGGTAV